MRASTLFAITVAVLLGLAVAIVAKVSGVFNPQKTTTQAAAPKPEINVLVAKQNLYKDYAVGPTDVQVRTLKPEEMAQYEQHKDQYFPAVPEAAVLRTATENIEADKPILRKNLSEIKLADSLGERLAPNMRAVNVALPKDRSAGGLIRVGDWVDVHLSSAIETTSKDNPATHTATIAHHARVIAKRNMLPNMILPLPAKEDVSFTLETNPYRAALIEFSKDKGNLSLALVGVGEQRELEARRAEMMDPKNKSKISPVDYEKLYPDSPEYKDEDVRIVNLVRGDQPIGEADLIRIFNLRTSPPPLAPLMVQMYEGVQHHSNVVFGASGSRTETSLQVSRPSRLIGAATSGGIYSPLFKAPSEGTECKKCKAKSAAGVGAGIVKPSSN